jgi:DNA helicase-2/ATP-dependent DNA helicase PcrA
MSSKPFELPPEIQKETSQREAIMHGKGPLMIIAGPGSGKTKVLVWRAVKLLLQDKVDPESIWLTTFTEKAARQLRAEIATILKEFDAPIQVSKMLVGTIHSTCLQLIKNHPEYFPDLLYPPEILDENKQLIFILSNYKRLRVDRACDTPGKRPDIGRIYEVMDHLNWLTDFEVAPEDYKKHVLDLFKKGDDVVRERDIWMTKTYREYLNLLQTSGYLDFGQILRRVADAIETKSLDKVIGQKIKHILVDEYQDVNLLQQYILTNVAKANPETNITVVGDDDQAIYQFRGAGVGTLRDFEKLFHPTKKELTTNFRSSKHLVEASSALIATDAPPERFAKKLRSDPDRKKEQLEVLKINAHLLSESAEKTAKLLRNLTQTGKIRRWGDIVILLRSIKPTHLEPYITALQNHNIPYTVLGRTGLFSTPQGIGFLLYFDFLTNPKPLFTGEVLKCSLLGLKKETVDAILAFDNSISKDKIEKEQINERDKKLLLFLFDTHEKASKFKMTPLQAIYSVLQASGFLNEATNSKDDETLRIVSKITKIAREFEEMHPPKIRAFTDYIKGLWEAGRAELPETAITEPNCLKIMTVHQAKGLEFPVVVVGEAVEGRFPSPNLGEAFYKPKEIAKRPTKEETHENEEKRLFYVAMTRARDLLIISGANKISELHKRTLGETRWLKNIPSHTVGSINTIISHIRKSLGWDYEFKKERKIFSFSKLNYYRFCPFRYKMVREIRFAFPPKTYFIVGKNMHEALEHIHLQAMKGSIVMQDDIGKIVENFWKDVGPTEMNARIKDSVIRYLKNYIQHFPNVLKSAYAVEKEFWVFFEEGVLTGRIDLIAKNEQKEFEIIDFKIGLIPGFDYNEQLKTYLLGARLGLNLDVTKAAIHVLKPTKSGTYFAPKRFTFSKQEIEDAKKLTLQTINDIENQRFNPTPSKEKCKECELLEYNLCPFAKISD